MINEITAFFNSGFEEAVTVSGTGYSKTSCLSIWDTDSVFSTDGPGVNARTTTVHLKSSDFTGITLKPKDTIVRGSATWYMQEIHDTGTGVIEITVSKSQGR
jgi:hypothetical protein